MKFAALRSFLISHFSFLILILLSTFYFLSSATLTHAASQATAAQTNTTTLPSSNTNPDVPNNLHNWTQNVMIEVMLSLTCQLVGVDPTTPDKQCLGVDQKTGRLGFLPTGNLAKREVGGAIGGMNSMISMLYTPPVRTSDYFQNLAQNFGITKKTYAQQTGTGFDGLRPLLTLWATFRNIVYLIFIIIFVVIGLAIMLRVKIDPRTVMTIQNQIPKIIVGMLLITFSFAIAGLLVDMMWISIHLIFNMVSNSSVEIARSVKDLNPSLLQGKNTVEAVSAWNMGKMAQDVAGPSVEVIQNILGISPNATTWHPVTGIAGDIVGLVSSLFPGNHTILNGSPINALVDLLSAGSALWGGWQVVHMPALQINGSFLGIGGGTNAGGLALNWSMALGLMQIIYPAVEAFLRYGVPFLIVYLIILIALLTALIRLWFSLLMAYIKILIDVVLAPFWIMGSLIPGNSISAGGWFRDLLANLLAFPAVIFMLLLGRVFMDGFANTANPFVPPLIGNLGTGTFSSLIGIGMILMTPNVISMLKEMLKAPKMDGGIGKSISGATGVVTGSTKSTAGAAGLAIMGDPFNPSKRGFGAIMSGWLRRQ